MTDAPDDRVKAAMETLEQMANLPCADMAVWDAHANAVQSLAAHVTALTEEREKLLAKTAHAIDQRWLAEVRANRAEARLAVVEGEREALRGSFSNFAGRINVAYMNREFDDLPAATVEQIVTALQAADLALTKAPKP